MNRPRILDLFSGAGLVADGLKAAGFDPTGVDNVAQPRYPGPFLLHDALALDERLLDSFPFIWASPPCLDATELKASARREQAAHGATLTVHRDLIPPTRDMLQRWAARTGGRWVIENVRKARLVDPVILNGFMFGLGVDVDGVRYHLQRERKFETNWPLVAPAFERKSPVIGVYGGHARCRSAKAGGRTSGDFPGVDDKTALMRAAMGVERRLTGAEVSQGVPPVYAEHVGRQLLGHPPRRPDRLRLRPASEAEEVRLRERPAGDPVLRLEDPGRPIRDLRRADLPDLHHRPRPRQRPVPDARRRMEGPPEMTTADQLKSKPGVRGATIILRSGGYFDFLAPDPSMIFIDDIAWGLANTCRFGGQSLAYYSVAQHSVLVSRAVPAELAMAGLLHDAAEAYVGDIVGPLKQLLPDYKVVEDRVERAVAAAFGLTLPWGSAIKNADLRLLRTEQRDLTSGHADNWNGLDAYPPLDEVITPLLPDAAAALFLERFEELVYQ